MKTLKKTLCLVLAVVMVVGALVLPASATYKDNTSIGTAYKDAVNVLESLKVMEGDANGNFKPTASIQRQEMAAIVYRLLTGDTAGYGKDKSAIYAPYAAKFTDVKSTDWAVGYIGYCANKGIIVGTNPAQTTFEPTRAIPANDVLAMLLRAVGYGQNNEYTGPGWTKNIASDANRLGLTKGITRKLDLVSERQEVALMTYQAALVAPRVTYVNGNYSYWHDDILDPNSENNVPLIVKTKPVTSDQTYDVWGAPEDTKTTTTYTWTYPATDVRPTKAVSVTNPHKALFETYDAVTECDIADELNIDGNHWADTYTNGAKNKDLSSTSEITTTTVKFEATDTTTKIGHEGRYFAVYEKPGFTGTESATNPKYIFVFKDTYLAVVNNTWGEVKDPAGHVLRKAGATVKVFYNTGAVCPTAQGSTASDFSAASPLTLDIEGSYTVGQKLAVNMVNVTNISGGKTYGNVAVAPSTTPGSVIKAASVLTPIDNVKVESITKSASTTLGLAGATQRIVGFVATDGTRYYYNYTYAVNTGTEGNVAHTVLDETAIGKSYTLWVDSEGNILDLAPTATATGYGVFTGATVKSLGIDKYVLECSVLTAENKTVTVTVGEPTTGKPFGSQTNAENFVKKTGNYTSTGALLNSLVYYEVGSSGEYNTLSTTNILTPTVVGDNTNKTIYSGRPGALSQDYQYDPIRALATSKTGTAGTNLTAGTLVNDKTVFFVAEYLPDNTTKDAKDYEFTGWHVYTGIKNIPNLSVADGSKIDLNGDGDVADSNANNVPGDGNETISALYVAAFDVGADGKPKAAAAGDFAKYVLVLYATKQDSPAAMAVKDYAYLVTADQLMDESRNTYTYPAIINGDSGKTLEVAVDTGALTAQGLYTYSSWTNGQGYKDVLLLDGSANTSADAPFAASFKIDKNKYSYADGVLRQYITDADTAGTTDILYSVADGCKVVRVNPVTGGVSDGSLDLLNVAKYADNCEIWYQFNEKGYVSLIYIIEDPKAVADDTPTAPADPENTLKLSDPSKDTFSCTDKNTISLTGGITPTGTGKADGQSVTLSGTIYEWTQSGYQKMGTVSGSGTEGSAINELKVTPSLTADTNYMVVLSGKANGVTSADITFYFNSGTIS